MRSLLGRFTPEKLEVERFLDKINIQDNGCWHWIAGLNNTNGYGQFCTSKRKNVYAHRYMYELVNGGIPENLCVCHSCDIRVCVNPSHLFLGTRRENNWNRDDKGRTNSPKGSKHFAAKLTEDQVQYIRNKYLQRSLSQQELGEQFGVSQTTIGQIIRKERWKHV